MPQHVADGDDADGSAFAIQHGQVPVTAHVHLVESKGQRVFGRDGLWIGGHELADGQVGKGINLSSDPGQ